ncbi:nuclear pore complex protein [Vigna unguiculata]|uniref:Nuclear pore complex protein n=1 Tax=Vigna unguiculata TaxID=3917 RepID=A0A4D6NBI0_VIGUN|nr:nuclear pore complex protein [Vigna unguiculata]
MFGGTSTGVFGAAQQSSPFSSNTASGASSSPASGSSVPAFESSSTPTFGSSSSSVGGSSVFGQMPAFGGFGSTPTQTSPFGATQQSQPAFGSSIFGSSTTFEGSSRLAFGATSIPAFGTPAFGASRPLEILVSTFGNTGIRQPGFGGQQRGGSRVASYTATTEAYSRTSVHTAKLESISAMPVYELKSHEELRLEDYVGDKGGSTVASYAATIEADSGTSGRIPKLESISAMPVYELKSHEELRWEDDQLGDKGGPLPSGQFTGLAGFSSSTTQTNAFSPSPVFGQSLANPFSSTTPNSNPFAPKSSPFSSGFGTFAANAFSSSAFGSSTSAATPTIFGSSPSPFGANSSLTPSFGAKCSIGSTVFQYRKFRSLFLMLARKHKVSAMLVLGLKAKICFNVILVMRSVYSVD